MRGVAFYGLVLATDWGQDAPFSRPLDTGYVVRCRRWLIGENPDAGQTFAGRLRDGQWVPPVGALLRGGPQYLEFYDRANPVAPRWRRFEYAGNTWEEVAE